ncbi:MAG: hypothetical protein DRO88_00295 [Promethearchaeia archaeon]|nr:MAG: hypothetical protein DRO88_00295 [Candidatus Lokiarchaeia archaeon]
MDIEQLIPEFNAFQQEFPDFDLFIILASDGEVLYSSNPEKVNPEETRSLMHAWLKRESACMFGQKRYPILSWEPLQFAARNVKGKDALVGTITQSSYYLLAHLKAGAELAPAIGAIQLNRKFWKLI